MKRKINISEYQMALPFGEMSRRFGYEDREWAFWVFASISICSLFLYFYAINAAAHHIAVRQNLEREVAQINSKLASLEFASIELKNAVTMETAKSLGFKEVKEPLYVSRNDIHSLTFNAAR